jgi:uncharacterized protein
MPPISNLTTLIRSMEPALNPGVYGFTSVADNASIDPQDVIAAIREPEGLSLILAEATAQRYGLPVLFRCAWITLTVHSDLAAVGLTAAFARALGDAGISCNVVAGAYHDHIFVPVDAAERAMAALRALQNQA